MCLWSQKAIIKLDVVSGTKGRKKIVEQNTGMQSSYCIPRFYDIRCKNR